MKQKSKITANQVKRRQTSLIKIGTMKFSWNVLIYKYGTDTIYPVCPRHGKRIVLNSEHSSKNARDGGIGEGLRLW